MPRPVVDQVYSSLAEHQASEQWDWQEVTADLQQWQGRFNSEFKLDLPPIALRIGGAASYCNAHFRPWPNDFGIRREVAFNERVLLQRLHGGEYWKVLGTLLHELLHCWQFAWGQPGRRNYHNDEFRAKADTYGLFVSRKGVTEYTGDGPFFDQLEKYGVEVPKVYPPLMQIGVSKLKKWTCLCPVNVRVAIRDFRARCLICGSDFRLDD